MWGSYGKFEIVKVDIMRYSTPKVKQKNKKALLTLYGKTSYLKFIRR
jgi:hypothetical protein